MKSMNSIFALIIILFLTYNSEAQQQYPYKMDPIPNQPTGTFVLYNQGAAASFNYFYLTGDGFFKSSNYSKRWFPSHIAGDAFRTISYELDPYVQGPPKKGIRLTNHVVSPNLMHTPTNVPGGSAIGTSWSPSPSSYNYFILKAKRPSVSRAKECIEIHYNSAETQIDELLASIEDSYPHTSTKWFTNRTNEISTFPGYNESIKWNYSSLMVGDTGLIYIPMKSLLPQTSEIKLGTKFCHENTLREYAFQVAGTPHDPNVITVDEECFYQTLDEAASENIILGSKLLNYKLRFQNQGDGPAQNVKIEMDFDQKVDPFSFQIIESEYPCTYQINHVQSNGVITYRLIMYFQNIQLPGIGQEQPTITYDESESWVRFQLCTGATYINQLIQNQDCKADPSLCCFNHQANIYFDDQPAVTTNTATTCVVCNSTLTVMKRNSCSLEIRNKLSKNQEDVQVIPNPATDNIQFNIAKEFSNVDLELFDSSGKLYSKINFTYLDKNTIIDVKTLPSGIYIARVKGIDEVTVLRFVKQ